MRYFTWQEPYYLHPACKLFANATFTASEDCIREYYLQKYRGDLIDRTYAVEAFMCDFNAWETDEHGKKL